MSSPVICNASHSDYPYRLLQLGEKRSRTVALQVLILTQGVRVILGWTIRLCYYPLNSIYIWN
jgi:hypothetical protein